MKPLPTATDKKVSQFCSGLNTPSFPVPQFISPTRAAFSILPTTSSAYSPMTPFHRVALVKSLNAFRYCLLERAVIIPMVLSRETFLPPKFSMMFVNFLPVVSNPSLTPKTPAFWSPLPATLPMPLRSGEKYSPTSSLWYSMADAPNAFANAFA